MNYPELELYIDGHWKRASGHPVLNPADESVLGTVPHATTADLDDALAAAERGFVLWRNTSPAKRAQIILKAASLIRTREGGTEGLQCYTVSKNVSHKMS